jgi:hypothetical protein
LYGGRVDLTHALHIRTKLDAGHACGAPHSLNPNEGLNCIVLVPAAAGIRYVRARNVIMNETRDEC